MNDARPVAGEGADVAAQPPARPRLSVGVLTMNEAARIERCLASAALVADQLVVVDSGSSDGTLDIARRHTPHVHLHADWQGFGVQRDRMLRHLDGDFVFFLDADEVVTPELAAEMRAAIAAGGFDAWTIQWRQFVLGRPLAPYLESSRVLRLFRRDALAGYRAVVHEEPVWSEALGRTPRIGALRARLEHHPRDSVSAALKKSTQYAILGAGKRRPAGKRGGVLVGLLSALRVFIASYAFKLGFLNGARGFLLASFMAYENFFKYVIVRYDADIDTPRRG